MLEGGTLPWVMSWPGHLSPFGCLLVLSMGLLVGFRGWVVPGLRSTCHSPYWCVLFYCSRSILSLGSAFFHDHSRHIPCKSPLPYNPLRCGRSYNIFCKSWVVWHTILIPDTSLHISRMVCPSSALELLFFPQSPARSCLLFLLFVV